MHRRECAPDLLLLWELSKSQITLLSDREIKYQHLQELKCSR